MARKWITCAGFAGVLLSPVFGCTEKGERRDANGVADSSLSAGGGAGSGVEVGTVGGAGSGVEVGTVGGVHADAKDSQGQTAVIDAWSMADGEMADPGAPPGQLGTKGEAHLFLADKEVGYIFFAALAPEQASLAHVFFRPEHGGSVNVTDYYVSLILDRATWRTGTYSGALGGQAVITLSTGAEYQSKATEASVTATLTSATAIEGNVYLGGRLTMSLAAKSGGEPLRVEARLN